MSAAKLPLHRLGAWLSLLVSLSLAGCVHSPVEKRLMPGSPTSGLRGSLAASASEIRALEAQLVRLDSSVQVEEARRVAACAFEHSRELARDYRVVRPALFHNFLVNVGLKKRGLCYHWAEDLLAQLQTLQLVTLEPRWGMARAGTLREHNAVVITARGQDFDHGIVLDAWRRSGRMVWVPVAKDRYPWEEGETNAIAVPSIGER